MATVSTQASQQVRAHETGAGLVIEVDVPPEVDPASVEVTLDKGVLTVTVPYARRHGHIPGFHPDASGV
jgi:HSP20 family molecular chaperone IbpA